MKKKNKKCSDHLVSWADKRYNIASAKKRRGERLQIQTCPGILDISDICGHLPDVQP